MLNRSAILVTGAINTDLVATMNSAPGPGETITGTSFAIHGGGKGANQAVSAARSGGAVAMLGAVGADDFGKARISDLQGEGINISWIQHIATYPTGVALIFVEEKGENRIVFVPGATSRIEANFCLNALTDVHPSFLLATNELPFQSLRELFEHARRQGVQIVLNATPDPEVARDLLHLIDIVILNSGEALRINGRSGDLDPVQAIADLRCLGPTTVILTLGAAGAVGNDGDQIFAHRPAEVEVIDTTGAGDTFCGAFIAALANGDSITGASRYGVRASSLSVTRAGAQSSIPTQKQVENFFGTDR